ncbi:phytanoyl-CoA dioxygenase (PhyH) superfamily protein [Streptomyces himastatinicus ATCC 53653]|uniref:Phytanoyl-CoA dioxygenase (PhyH) superfamily protein n=1 Tax=Streptomyces himastatinicus ATCC 53653 TaxID=457427 RepID=D9WVA0_9ACTN|nr:phytanoyl-CoA dioxygenase family protein [Streptomyces himastatinicus]EFL20298.1 phytanoyl-CoA dioxygenase (PhyH) superfamily protein [Streptomyces himastatinicus ATCC 53653]
MAARPAREQLLTSARMARFVAHGYLRLNSVVPDALNDQALGVLAAGVPAVPYGTPVAEAFPEGSFARSLLDLPAIAGALSSLVGPDPTIDHHAVHIRQPQEGQAQPLHGDAIIDVRPDAFDVQLMYYPRAVTLEAGGTLIVPGSHLRRTNESDTGRYQNLLGQQRMVCEAGTVLILHHGIWHSGRRNDSGVPRYMFKIRLNPTVPQVRLWNTDDLGDPAVAEELRTRFPWYEQATGRLELHNRIRLWRALTGDPSFDLDHWVTRVTNRPGRNTAHT